MQCCVLKLLISICSSFEKKGLIYPMQYMYKCPHNKKTDRIYSCEWNLNYFDISIFPEVYLHEQWMKPFKYVIWFFKFFHFFSLALCTNPRRFATSGVRGGGVSILLLLPLIVSDRHPNNQTHINTVLLERLWTLRANGDFKFSCTVLTLRNT